MAEAVIKTTGRWGLQSLQLGVNEIASAIVIGKHVGSVLTRSDDARIFDIIETRYHVHVRQLPVWLDKVEFSRDATLFGHGMRQIKADKIMEDVHISQLQGFTTFVTLCTRYVLSTPDIQSIIYECLQNGLCGCLNRGELEKDTLPYNIKPLVIHFVQACLDADADSNQSQDARTWMAQLAHLAEYPFRSKGIPARSKQAVKSMLCDMFNRNESIQDIVANLDRNSFPAASYHPIGNRVHDTMHIDAAYAALAATANGANVVVQAMKARSTECFPSGRDIEQETFVVRLWLTKPPENIMGVLRYSNQDSLSEHNADTRTTDTPDENVPRHYTVFGGSQEVAISVANRLGFKAKYMTMSRENAVMMLWSEGMKLAYNQLQWKIHEHHFTPGSLRPLASENHSNPLKWKLIVPETTELAPQAVTLTKALAFAAPGLVPISRLLAAVVHKLHLLDSYTSGGDDLESDLLAAMRFVAIATSIGLLHTSTRLAGDNCNSYALSIDSVDQNPKGGLWAFLTSALSYFGVGQHEILWAASTLWGGATLESQGRAVVDGAVMGIVAPHCTVIMDILRDPESFASNLAQVPQLMVCRGSVPMLPRSQHTGFVQTKTTEDENSRRAAQARGVQNKSRRQGAPMSNELIVAFEPAVSDPSYGTFCCWCGGVLTYELNPLTVLKNLSEDFKLNQNNIRATRRFLDIKGKEADEIIAHLERNVDRCIGAGLPPSDDQNGPSSLQMIWLSQEELLRGGRLDTGHSLVLFEAHGIPSWLVCAAGAVDESAKVSIWCGNIRDLLAFFKDEWIPGNVWILIRNPL